MQTILGATGIIGIETARQLPAYTEKIRLVSRNPKAVNPSDECVSANLLDPEAVDKAVSGSELVYLTAGLRYSAKIWEKEWPQVMQNTIAACLKNGSKLVFFDNMYMYAPDALGHMTEDTRIAPVCRKGRVRAHLLDMLNTAEKQHGLTYMVVRSADFYGPDNTNSMLIETVFRPLSKGEKANWLGDPQRLHSFTYTPDAGKATALLGNSPDAFGQSWHVPTAAARKGVDWIRDISGALGTEPKYRAVSKNMLRLLGLFIPVMRETVEMYYQFDRDYVFSGKKMEEHYGFKPTPADEAIRTIIKTNFSS